MEQLEKIYKLVFNTANYGITVTDHQHLLLTANAYFCKITGYDQEELEGQSIFGMLPPKIRPKVANMYKDIAEGIPHPERIIKLISKDNCPIVLSLSIQYVQEGEEKYFINSFKSIDANDRYVNLFKETEKAAKIGGWEIDLISRQPLISDACRNIYDIGPEVQITIEESLRFYPSEYRLKLNHALETASKEGKTFHLELQLVSAKGKTKWVKITCNPLTVERQTVKLYGTLQDITEEKNRHEFLRQLIDAIPSLILVKDKKGRLILVNKALASFYHKAPEDIVGKTNQELGLHSAEVIEKFDAEDQAILASEIPHIVLEEKATHANGEEYWFKTVKTPVLTENGTIEQILIIATDITSRKRTEQQVIDSEKYFRALIENGFDCIVLYDKEGKITYASPTVEKVFGYTEKELLGRNGAEFVHPDDREKRSSFVKEIREGKERNWVIQERIWHKNGYYCWVEVSVTNLLDEPSVRSIVASFRDITDRKIAEQKQKQALEKEKVLNESLTKTNAELDQFVYSTSHNLRAPLTSILGIIHILKAEGGVGEHAELIHLIEKSIYQLDATIQEITDYARNNRIEVAVEPIDFEKIISDTIEGLKFMEGAGRVSIHYEIDNHLEFYSDTRRLKVIFNNLLSNAIKYQNFKSAQPRINILVKRLDKNMMIKVQDNGIGIRADQQDKVFNMFYRATDRSNGAGLGLYIVKETLVKLNGTIHIETTYGEGTAFTLKVPNLG